MKKLFIITLMVIFGATAFMSCDKTQETLNESGFRDVRIPENFGITDFQKSNNAIVIIPEEERIVEKKFYLKLPDKEIFGTQIIELDEIGNMINFKISDNVFIETGLDTNFLFDYIEKNPNSDLTKGIGSCLKACGDESIEHPGWCKAGCWAELALEVAAVVIAAAAL
ncbi:MAG: hypothetical protein PWP52_1883 [Bacteroidales bacterium]|jgi:hypothetical protein|nr:hypothetical protein [Bacteroidales bacterium]